jgi:hypothetical protein
MGQYNNKNNYYHNFKIQLEGRLVAKHKSQVGLTIDSGQCKDKNKYYHSFKTQLEDRLGVRLMSWVVLTIDPG